MATILISFSVNKLPKLANFVQFIRMLMFCPENWGAGPVGAPLATPLVQGLL